MAHSVIIHLVNEDPILADMETLPSETATCVAFTNPRKRDGKMAQWVTPGATAFILAMSRINFIEVMTSEEAKRSVVEFFRES